MNRIIFSGMFLFLAACAAIEPKQPELGDGHIQQAEAPSAAEIPQLVEKLPVLPEPGTPRELDTYTILVNEVPVKELLFALARDASINVDIAPEINGNVIIYAVDQTLPQILSRLSRQIDLRYTFDGDNLVITPDTPYLHTYAIDYVNISRTTTGSNAVATQISSTSSGGLTQGGGGSGNNSTTDVESVSGNYFWPTLVANVAAILGEEPESGQTSAVPISQSVIPYPESGLLSVRATSRQHEQLQRFIDILLASARRQVLIQATIAEVTLSDQYQAGIDWSAMAGNFGVVISSLDGLPSLSGEVSEAFAFTYPDLDPTPGENSITATVNLLDQFGDTRVLSSPQLMVLNNQTALLKVVDNIVYFDVDAEAAPGTQGGSPVTAVDTTARTVPVGIVMTVTPQISASEEVLLNVRPTISTITGFVNDPNPQLTIPNPVPRIQVRELESVLRLTNGQIGVLGGLMQDESRDVKRGVPGLSDIPLLGALFSATNKEYVKTELVVFLRPVVVKTPSIEEDLKQFKPFLNSAWQQENGIE